MCTIDAKHNILHINNKMLTMSCVDNEYHMYLKLSEMARTCLPCFKTIPAQCRTRSQGMYHVCDITIQQRDVRNIDSWSNYK